MELYIDFIQIWIEWYSLLLLPFLWAHTRALVWLKGSITNFYMKSKYLQVNRISNNHNLFWLLERVKRTHYMKSTVRSYLLHPCIPCSILYFFRHIIDWGSYDCLCKTKVWRSEAFPINFRNAKPRTRQKIGIMFSLVLFFLSIFNASHCIHQHLT